MSEPVNTRLTHVNELIDGSFDSIKTAVFLVGPPASGKSSLAEALLKKNYSRLSMDAIRGELFGDEGIYGDQKKVKKVLDERLEAAIAAGEQILLDNTNLHRGTREKVIKRLRDANYSNIVLFVMMTPLDVCLERNRKRSRVVDEKVLTTLHEQMLGSGAVKAEEGTVIVLHPGMDKDNFLVEC